MIRMPAASGGGPAPHLCGERAVSDRRIVPRSKLVGEQLEDDQEAGERGHHRDLGTGGTTPASARRRARPPRRRACPVSFRGADRVSHRLRPHARARLSPPLLPPAPLVCVATEPLPPLLPLLPLVWVATGCEVPVLDGAPLDCETTGSLVAGGAGDGAATGAGGGPPDQSRVGWAASGRSRSWASASRGPCGA